MDFSQHLLKITFDSLSEKDQDIFWRQHVHKLTLDFVEDGMKLCVICKYLSYSGDCGLDRYCLECDKDSIYVCDGCYDSIACCCGEYVCYYCISNGLHVHIESVQNES